ncbi:MAG: universal stress protein [Nitrososphaera sp.]|uniref:universal stress protein n=1 Tax=Nitrososphaera sp. TaxID=1971748 RepID=UPI003D6F7A26
MPEQKISRILVPIDGSENAFRAASFAADMARRYGSELVLAYALEINPTLSAIGMPGVSAQEIKRLKEVARKEVDPWFARTIKEGGSDLAVRTEIIESPLSLVGTIIDYAEKDAVDLIIMGSRGRTGFKKLLLGSVASGVVTYAPCPVMVIK